MRKKIFITFLLAIAIVAVSSISRAAIEIKPGTTTYKGINVSDSYQICYNLRANDTTLGSNSLDPHLTLNKDWSAVSYLGASAYGSARSQYGVEVKIGERTYYSITGNKSGVMDFGYTWTQTASLYDGDGQNYPNYTKNLQDNIGTKYVETLPTTNDVESTKGLGYAETTDWYKPSEDRYNKYAAYPLKTRPVGIRRNIFGYTYYYVNDSDYYSSGYAMGTGMPSDYATFRPVIWN